ncbi:CAP domain-containing protein [Paenibacillus sp. NPDC058071]|uniref:CAP domain-containing protein n=1 Tax=Paenibacillus sp. NPDC058071 TaxID=3346326 RepID=UPI0036DC6E57
MQTLRVGIASVAAAALIGTGVGATNVSAAPAANTNVTAKTFTVSNFNNDLLKQIADQYGIDLSKISFNGITITFPGANNGAGTVTKPDTGNNGSTTKPDTGNNGSTTKPGTGNNGSTTKPGTGNNGSTTKPGTGNNGSTTKPGTGNNGSTTKPDTGNNGSASLSEFQQQVVNLVNQERAKGGLSPLTVDTLLTKVAQEKARDMDVNKYFSHTSPTYGSPFDMMKQFGVTYSYAGENIAAGQRTPQEVMNAWMNSPGHRQNIMSPNFKKIGVGFVNNQWVQEFTG